MTTATNGLILEFTIGDRLRKARETAGLEQGELADRMAISRKTVSNNESGRVKPRRIVIRAWAMATGVDEHWLETGETPTGPGPGGGLDGERARRDSNPKPSDPKVLSITRYLAPVGDAA